MKTLPYRVEKNRLLLLILFLFSVHNAAAQDTIFINLQKVLTWGGANNLTIKEYKERQELSLAELTNAKEWWLPRIYVGGQTQQLWGAAMNADGRFFLDVNRQNFWGGLGVSANWDFAEGIYNAKSTKLKNQASKYLTQAKRNRQLLQIINSYYELMTAQFSYDAYQNLVNKSNSIVKQIQVQVENGLHYQSELLLAKSNKNNLQVELLNVKRSYYNALAALKKLLHIGQNLHLVSIEKVLLPLELGSESGRVTDSTYLGRPEIKANELYLQALQTELKKYTTGLFIPELNVGTQASYFGRISGNVSPMFPADYPQTQQLYPTGGLNISFLWKIPLGALTYQGGKKIYNSKMRLNTIETEQIKAQIGEEISNAYADVRLRKEQIEIAKEALDFTTEALSESIERQKIGTAKPFEVFQAQQFFLQSQLNYLKAVSAYNIAQYALKVARGEDL